MTRKRVAVTTKPGHGAKYIPDLERRLSCCSKNYHKLCQLLPPDLVETRALRLPMGKLGDLVFNLDIVSEYTWSLLIQYAHFKMPIWMSGTTVQVRVYHDAKLAEAVAFMGNSKAEGTIGIHEPVRLYPDEKQALDDFLSEWLDMAIVSCKPK